MVVVVSLLVVRVLSLALMRTRRHLVQLEGVPGTDRSHVEADHAHASRSVAPSAATSAQDRGDLITSETLLQADEGGVIPPGDLPIGHGQQTVCQTTRSGSVLKLIEEHCVTDACMRGVGAL
ncbi:hypothetical protein PR003_g12228 [Phytophthora rubi]|uniref:Secreted protein n=1 Tax=Phytophthora rubi TaxID=129364 RepID=A0A6A3LXZ2_9STRA|nr:hypothetical protein PR002_g11838 [Phytophthora rubi]KAE9029114.1 hypothetical protein PR001_g11586 [Phytophthora rubi]KAE9336992.1 hypothetical protein PR003_g12228 [Phytophthora rubi]